MNPPAFEEANIQLGENSPSKYDLRGSYIESRPKKENPPRRGQSAIYISDSKVAIAEIQPQTLNLTQSNNAVLNEPDKTKKRKSFTFLSKKKKGSNDNVGTLKEEEQK